MNLKDRVKLFEDDAAILDTIASRYGEHTREYGALKHAAIALWYVLSEDCEGFQKYVAKFEGNLTPDQRAHLKALGIDPDADPDAPDAPSQS